MQKPTILGSILMSKKKSVPLIWLLCLILMVSTVVFISCQEPGESLIPVDAPTFSSTPDAVAPYVGAQQVTLSSATTGATIKYSLNGTDFTTYTVPIDITVTTTLYAYATKEGMTNSDTVSKIYTINAEENDSYINIKIKEIGTEKIKYEFSLKYGISNFYDLQYEVSTIPELDSLSARQVTFSTPAIDNRVSIFGVDSNTPFTFSDSMPEGKTLMMIGFPPAVGTYDDDDDVSEVSFQSTADDLEYDMIEFYLYGETYIMTISKYGDIGEYTEGTIICESCTLYSSSSLDNYQSRSNIGDYKVEIEFKAKRAEDIRIYHLNLNENGGTVNELDPGYGHYPPNTNFELPGFVDYGFDFEKTGYTFTGWNTQSDGNGTFYGEGESFTMPNNDVTLYAVWEEPYDGGVGSLVFYDKGNDDGGWRYLEAAPSDIVIGSDYGHVFGYYRTSPTGGNLEVGTTKATVGTGKANTEALVQAMGNSAYTSSDGTGTTTEYAAKLCADYEIDGHSDWFLPSKAELNQMYQNLHLLNKGSFSNGSYWSSSEYSANIAWAQSFSNGDQDYGGRYVKYRVRPVRAF